MTSYLRACAGCGGSFAADNRPGPYYCPKCHKANVDAFDPQPGDTVMTLLPSGAPRESYRPVWIIRRFEGNEVVVRQLGFPEADERRFPVGSLDPATWTRRP